MVIEADARWRKVIWYLPRLLKERVIFLVGQLKITWLTWFVAQLLFLESENPE